MHIVRNVKEALSERHAYLYAPDGVGQAAIPYILGYLPELEVVTDVPKSGLVLFSWSYATQDIGWTQSTMARIIIGGKHVQLLAKYEGLPELPNVSYFTGEYIDARERIETRVQPNYSVVLKALPYIDGLPVHSGVGCSWRRCSFCIMDYSVEQFAQFDPYYVATIVNQANKHGKIARLSAEEHKIDWLVELETHLGDNAAYWCNVRASESEWARLRYLRSVFIGTEFLCDTVLSRVNKGLTAKQIMFSIEAALDAGIDVETIVILDLAENEQERAEHRENILALLHRAQRKPLKAGRLMVIGTKLIPKHNNLFALSNGQVVWRYEKGEKKYRVKRVAQGPKV